MKNLPHFNDVNSIEESPAAFSCDILLENLMISCKFVCRHLQFDIDKFTIDGRKLMALTKC